MNELNKRLLSKSWNYDELKEDLRTLHDHSLSFISNQSIEFDSLFIEENIDNSCISDQKNIERRPSIKVEAPQYNSDSDDDNNIEANTIEFTNEYIKADLNYLPEDEPSNIVSVLLNGEMNEEFKDELNESIDKSWRNFDNAIRDVQKKMLNESIEMDMKLINDNEPIEIMLNQCDQKYHEELENSINDLNQILEQNILNQNEKLKQHIIKEKKLQQEARQAAIEAARKKAEKERLEKERLEKERKKVEEKKKKEAARLQMAKLAAEKKIEDEKKKAQISPKKDKKPQVENKNMSSKIASTTQNKELQNNIIEVRRQKLLLMKQKAEGIKQNDQMRKYCNTKLKIKLNRPINTLATTQQSVAQMSEQIRNALTEAKSLGEAPYANALVVLCEKLINKMASVGVDALVKAFPYAYLTHNIICFEPQLLDLLLAQLNETCIYTIPIYLSKKNYSSTMNYMKALGYKISNDNKVEDESKYFSRMFGCICFFIALMVLPGSQIKIGLNDAWQWMAKFLNKKPRSCTSTVLLAFLDIGCYDMQHKYNKQFPKIMRLLQRQFLPLLWEKTDEQKAALSRVRLFLKNYWDKNGQIDPPAGRNLPSKQMSEQGIKQISQADYHARE